MDLVAIIVARFSPWLNAKCCLKTRENVPLSNAEIGRFGEIVARHWMRARGARILAKNYRARGGGEVDLVAREKRLLLFTEVKTRRSCAQGRGFDAVDRAKQRLIERGANAWLGKLRSREVPWRFDVIEVILEEGKRPLVRRIENAF